jgi:HD-like signal output (HDOD) protein
MTSAQPHREMPSYYQEIMDAIKSDRLRLPTQPKTFLAIQELSEDPDITVGQLNEVISKDPALAIRIIGLANSPMMRGRVNVSSLDAAISRLGIRFVTYVSMGLAMKQLFMAKHRPIDEQMQIVWDHSGKVASTSYCIANFLKAFPPEEAMLAGLVHEFGKLPLLSYADQNFAKFKDFSMFEQFMQTYHAKLGKQILTLWKFSPQIANTPEQLSNIFLNSDQALLADVVLVSKLYVLSNNESGRPLPLLENETIPAYERLGLAPGGNLAKNQSMKNVLQSTHQIFA